MLAGQPAGGGHHLDLGCFGGRLAGWLARRDDQRHDLPDRHQRALGSQDAGQDAVAGCLDLDGRLRRLDLGDALPLPHLITDILQPLHHGAVGHPHPGLGQPDLGRHGRGYFSVWRTASAIRSGPG